MNTSVSVSNAHVLLPRGQRVDRKKCTLLNALQSRFCGEARLTAPMATLPLDHGRVEDPLQEVQSLQKDLKAFSRAVNKPLRDNITYPTFTLETAHSSRRGLSASQNPGDVAILDRLRFIRALPGKAQTSALVRQALTLQDGNARAPSTSSTPPPAQTHRKGSAQQTPRQDPAVSPPDNLAPVTAIGFQDQLYDASGAIDLTRVRLKVKQHQQDLIAAGLQALPEEPEPAVPEPIPQDAQQSKLRWQLASGKTNTTAGTDYNLRYLVDYAFLICCNLRVPRLAVSVRLGSSASLDFVTV